MDIQASPEHEDVDSSSLRHSRESSIERAGARRNSRSRDSSEDRTPSLHGPKDSTGRPPNARCSRFDAEDLVKQSGLENPIRYINGELVRKGDFVMRTRPVLSTRAGKSDEHDLYDGPFAIIELISLRKSLQLRPHNIGLKGHSQRSGEAPEGGGPVDGGTQTVYTLVKGEEIKKGRVTSKRTAIQLEDSDFDKIAVSLAFPQLSKARDNANVTLKSVLPVFFPSEGPALQTISPDKLGERLTHRVANFGDPGGHQSIERSEDQVFGIFITPRDIVEAVEIIDPESIDESESTNGDFEVNKLRYIRLRVKPGEGADWPSIDIEEDPFLWRMIQTHPELSEFYQQGLVLHVEYLVSWSGWPSEDDAWYGDDATTRLPLDMKRELQHHWGTKKPQVIDAQGKHIEGPNSRTRKRPHTKLKRSATLPPASRATLEPTSRVAQQPAGDCPGTGNEAVHHASQPPIEEAGRATGARSASEVPSSHSTSQRLQDTIPYANSNQAPLSADGQVYIDQPSAITLDSGLDFRLSQSFYQALPPSLLQELRDQITNSASPEDQQAQVVALINRKTAQYVAESALAASTSHAAEPTQLQPLSPSALNTRKRERQDNQKVRYRRPQGVVRSTARAQSLPSRVEQSTARSSQRSLGKRPMEFPDADDENLNQDQGGFLDEDEDSFSEMIDYSGGGSKEAEQAAEVLQDLSSRTIDEEYDAASPPSTGIRKPRSLFGGPSRQRSHN